MANYSFRDPGDAIPDGATIDSGNFAQVRPDTPIMVGKPLTINGGNWTNARKDAAWTINGGNWTQVDQCSHLHPHLINKGLIECAVDCKHIVDTDTITVDGVIVDTVYHYADIYGGAE